MQKELNRRQQLFAEAYIECGNATEAAKRAGYSEKNADVTGPRLLRNVGISEYIARRTREQDEAMVASADEVMRFFSSAQDLPYFLDRKEDLIIIIKGGFNAFILLCL